MDRKYVSSKMDLENDIEIVYFNKVDDAKSTIIYDEFNEHFDIINNNVVKLYQKNPE